MRHLLHLTLSAALLLGVAACDAEPDEDDLPDDTAMTDQAAGDWITLFDGSAASLESNWRGYRKDAVPAKWTVDDGAIHFAPDAEGEGGDIITQQPYDDFELELEWKISEGGNSGIFYRVQESNQYGNTYHTGPEYQILDNDGHADAQNGLDRTAGANYALHEPATDATRPVGEWNQTRIVVDGAHVEHWLNGEKVVEYELWSDDWKARVAGSKFTEWPDYGLAQTGHIALQDHSDDVWYRNIRVRPLGS